MKSISAFKPTLTKLETLIRQLEINTGVQHKQSPFDGIIEPIVTPLHDKPAQPSQPTSKPQIEKKQEQQIQEQPKQEEQQQQQQPKQQKQKAQAKPTPDPKPDYGKFVDIVNIDMRVGELKKVWIHPESDKLYCEQIDIGTEVREIASGLQQFIPIADMTGLVIVLVNLKGRKLANFMSNGMVMCASNADHSKVELLRPAPGSKVGERVKIVGHEHFFNDKMEETLNPKKKYLENASPFLKVNEQLQATFDGHLLVTQSGPIVCNTLAGGSIS